MKSKIFLSMLVIVVALSMVVGGTMAYFNDSDIVGSNTFTAGTLNVDLNGDTNTIQLGAVNNMAPGDVMANTATVLIENAGSINLAWVGQWILSGDAALQDYIYIDSMQMEFLAPDEVTWWTAPDKFITDGVGSGDYEKYINYAIDTNVGKITMKKWISTNGAGMCPGTVFQHTGALKPGYHYRLTFKLGLLPSAPNAVMGQSVGVAFKVDANQIKAGALIFDTLAWYEAQIANQP